MGITGVWNLNKEFDKLKINSETMLVVYLTQIVSGNMFIPTSTNKIFVDSPTVFLWAKDGNFADRTLRWLITRMPFPEQKREHFMCWEGCFSKCGSISKALLEKYKGYID